MTTSAGCFWERDRGRERDVVQPHERAPPPASSKPTLPPKGPVSEHRHSRVSAPPQEFRRNSVISFVHSSGEGPQAPGSHTASNPHSVTPCASTSPFVIKPCKLLWGLNQLIYTKCLAPCKCPQFRCLGSAATHNEEALKKFCSVRVRLQRSAASAGVPSKDTRPPESPLPPFVPASSVRLEFYVLGTFWLLTWGWGDGVTYSTV